MLYDANDSGVGRLLDLYGEYSEDEATYLAKLLAPGDVVVEVGANIGAHTIGLANVVGSEGRVIAIVAHPAHFQLLSTNIALNSLGNVQTINLAAGATQGSINLPDVDFKRPENFGIVELSPGGAGAEVTVAPLDDLLTLDACKLIKIDVEGMEREVILGAKAIIDRCQPAIYVENDRKDKSPALISTLLDLGYKLFWHLPTLFSADNFFGNPDNVFPNVASANMLCAPPWLTVKGLEKSRVTGPDQTWEDFV